MPWYRRAWLRLTTRKTRAAGDRPRSRRRLIGGAGGGLLSSWVTKAIVLAIVVVVILALIGPWRGSIRNDVHRDINDVHHTYNPVHPVAAAATSSAPGHPAEFAIDGASNTSWQTNAPRSGVGQRLAIRLAAATDLDRIGFLNGDQDTPQAYLTQARPESVRVVFGGAHPETKDFTLKDTATFQTFGISPKEVSLITVFILSVYPSDTGRNAAITEVELFTPN